MTIHTFAADLSDRIPEMARDGKLNNQKLIEQMLQQFIDSKNCHWTFDEAHWSWDTKCGGKFQFMNDGPVENEAKFCQYCGGKIIL